MKLLCLRVLYCCWNVAALFMLFNEYVSTIKYTPKSIYFFYIIFLMPLLKSRDVWEVRCLKTFLPLMVHCVIRWYTYSRKRGYRVVAVSCAIFNMHARTPAARSANISLVYCKHNSILSYVKQSHNYGKGKKKFRCPHACEIILSWIL